MAFCFLLKGDLLPLQAVLMVLSSCSFWCPENSLSLLHFWMITLLAKSPCCELLCFSTLKMSCHSLLVRQHCCGGISWYSYGFPMYVTMCVFSSCFLQNCLFIFNFCHVNYNVFLGGSLGLSCSKLCVSWTWMSLSFSRIGNFSAIISSVFVFVPVSFFSFSFWDP